MARSILGRGGVPTPLARSLILAALISTGVLGLVPRAALANAATLPAYDGTMSFPPIQSPSDPEEFSWGVELGEGQELELIDEQTATVFYKDRTPALSIHPAEAHDAAGAAVPTSLSVSEGSIVTLIVHHRAGNPAAGGAPFAYPITWGPALETGYRPPGIIGARSEQELREEREQREKEQRKAARHRWTANHCVVPRLKGRSLSAARKQLRSVGCRVGEVTRRKGATARTGKVLAQNPKPGAVRARGSAVGLTLGH